MVAQPLYSIAEYLAFEREAEDRHEYLDGFIYAMAGESPAHADISANLVILVGEQLRDSPCRVRTKDTKVFSGPTEPRTVKGLFSYPDLVVICGEPKYHQEYRDVVVNPRVIIEVLSKSTEARDRGVKFHRYQSWSPTVTDYVLVTKTAPLVEHFQRQMDGSWSLRIHQGIEESFGIESINCALKLAEVYARVVFPEAEDTEGFGEFDLS